MKQIYAFGELVSQNVINELIEEYVEEKVTTEFVETLYEYEFRDNK